MNHVVVFLDHRRNVNGRVMVYCSELLYNKQYNLKYTAHTHTNIYIAIITHYKTLWFLINYYNLWHSIRMRMGNVILWFIVLESEIWWEEVCTVVCKYVIQWTLYASLMAGIKYRNVCKNSFSFSDIALLWLRGAIENHVRFCYPHTKFVLQTHL